MTDWKTLVLLLHLLLCDHRQVQKSSGHAHSSRNAFDALILILCLRCQKRAVSDFDSGGKPTICTNLAPASRISVFGQICKMVHTNTETFHIPISFEKLRS